MIQTVYQMIAFLLRYPDRQTYVILPELKEEIERIDHPELRADLQKFVSQTTDMTLDDWVDHYIEHFDFGRTTNLYVTYLKLGEQRERGLELLKLKKYYESHGFGVTDEELPDYLPLMLEFCANTSTEASDELLSMYAKAIVQIRNRIFDSNSYYFHLFDAIFKCMEWNGIVVGVEELEA